MALALVAALALAACSHGPGPALAPVPAAMAGERVTSPPTTDPPPTTYANPVAADVRHPFVLRVGSTYYAYGTGTPEAPVTVLRSGDLATWTRMDPAMAPGGLGRWVATGDALALGAVGALDLGRDAAGDRFVLYLSATSRATGRSCIGAATAADPTGPFVGLDEPLACPGFGARDPSPVRGGDRLQLAYATEGPDTGIEVLVLTDDGRARAPDHPRPTQVLVNPWGGWQDGVVDRPAVLVHGDGTATLLHGGGDPGGGRAVGSARCVATAEGLVRACATTPGAATWLAAGEDVAAPGGAQLFDDPDGHLWVAYDALPGGACRGPDCTGTRALHLDRACVAGAALRTDAPTTGERPLARSDDCAVDVAGGWAATWASGVTPPSAATWPTVGYSIVDGLHDQTLRQVVHTSVGGEEVRVTVSNRFGVEPLRVDRATVALAAERAGASPAVEAATLRPLAFAGSAQVVVEPGETVTSDAVGLAVPADHDLAVSLYLPTPTGPPNGHLWAAETSWIGPGDLAGSAGDGFTQPFTGSAFLTAVDVRGPEVTGTVVVLGDSLSDGLGVVEVDSGTRWTDLLHDRLVAAGEVGTGVVNVGLAGNSLLPTDDAVSGVNRLDRDVLARAGVTTVVVLLGTNDLPRRTAEEIVAALAGVVDRAHAAGVRVVGATIPPIGGPRAQAGPPLCGPGGAAPARREAVRAAVNERIRPGPGSVPFDAVVDVDAALRDPEDPTRVRCAHAGFGLNFHPSPEGHRAMAEAVDLAALLG